MVIIRITCITTYNHVTTYKCHNHYNEMINVFWLLNHWNSHKNTLNTQWWFCSHSMFSVHALPALLVPTICTPTAPCSHVLSVLSRYLFFQLSMFPLFSKFSLYSLVLTCSICSLHSLCSVSSLCSLGSLSSVCSLSSLWVFSPFSLSRSLSSLCSYLFSLSLSSLFLSVL